MSRGVTIAGYVLLAVAVLGWQLSAVVSGRRATLGHVLHAIKQSGPGRIALVVTWAWIGWHLFVRGSWR